VPIHNIYTLLGYTLLYKIK